jgi:two-component system chemotaxis sensor kinase CheA
VIELHDDGRRPGSRAHPAQAAERGLPIAENASDGAGVGPDLPAPAFSTAEQVTDLSGRGVGMDVVRKNIAALGGHVELRSRAGAGTTVSIRLPLTLAILDE